MRHLLSSRFFVRLALAAFIGSAVLTASGAAASAAGLPIGSSLSESVAFMLTRFGSSGFNSTGGSVPTPTPELRDEQIRPETREPAQNKTRDEDDGENAILASITVTTTADTLDAAVTCGAVTLASLPGPDGQTSLREAVCAANNNPGADTITFAVNGTFILTGLANEDNGNSGDLDIKQSIAIHGNGQMNTIIDGNSNERIFDVFPSTATTFEISNMTLQNGDTRGTSFQEGGAIYMHNNVTGIIDNVAVINNFSGANAAIESRGTLTMTSSTVSNNQTIPAAGTVTGGGLRIAGAATIDRTTISNNTVRGEGGGIAISVGVGVTVNITNSTISGNTASVTGGALGNGGGISTTGNQGTIHITNSTISGNRADNNGGGAYIVTPGGSSGLGSFIGVTVTNNTADFDNNGTGTGGGIAQNSALVSLRSTIVAGNFNSTAATRDDLSGSFSTTSEFNLIGDGTGSTGIIHAANSNQVGSGASPINPQLGPLAPNGGPTLTHALLSGSPAIDNGSNPLALPYDQRGPGFPRVNGTWPDIGAFEGISDTTPPDTTITSNPANPTNSSTATFTFTGSDNQTPPGLLTFQCKLNSDAFTACTSPQSYVGLSEGSHTFQVRAIDVSGNIDPTPASFTWTIDATPPDTTITSNPPSQSNSTSAEFTYSSNETPVSFQCSIDGSSFAACPASYTGLSAGSHTFQVRAVDAAGNIDPTPASYTWTIDTVSPETTITSNPSNPTNSSTATFSFTGLDDQTSSGLMTFQCSLDGAAFTSCTSPETFVGLAEGSHTIQVRAIDLAGNIDPTPASYTWTIDTTPPNTTITSNPPDPSNSSTATFTFTANEASTFQCSINGGSFVPCTSPQTYVGLADGPHTFAVRARDAAGNNDPTPATYEWTIDTTPPNTTITVNPPNPSNISSAAFSFTSNETGSNFQCSLDGASFSSCSPPQTYAILADGSHTFQVRAVDAAGNVDPTPATYTWTIDTAPPDTTITSNPPNPSASTSAAFTFTSNESGVTFACSLDSAAFTACTSPQTYTGLSSGSHNFRVRATDAAGNTDPTPASYTWVINSPPSITAATGITRVQGTSSVSQIAIVADPDQAANTLIVTVNNAGSATVNGVTVSGITINAAGQVSATVAAACGSTGANFTLRVADSAGASATATLTITVINENVPPVINPIANVVATLPSGSATSMPVSFPLPTATDNCSTPIVTTNPVSGSVFPVGTTVVNVTAVDANGNMATATFTVTVQYPFTGFTGRAAVNPPGVNYTSAGNTMPLWFSLGGDRGLDIFAAGSPSSQQVSCKTGATMGASSPAFASPGLMYSGGQYVYYWSTDPSWAGTCRVFSATFKDGTTKTLNFSFYY